MSARVLEVKRHPDGRVHTFACEPVSMETDPAVVRFVADQPIGPYPPGTVTLGFFWRRRPYDLYRLRSPGDRPLGYRFDVVDEVRITPQRIEYLDLLLDIRVEPDGAVVVEDEDEVAEAADAGLLSPTQVNLIEETRNELVAGHHRIMEEIEGLVRGFTD